jgi:hypothetical protein
VKRDFIAWALLFVVGFIQFPIFFVIYRPLWPFLRKKAPLLLAGCGRPLVIVAGVLLIVIPGYLVVMFANQILRPVAGYALAGTWGAGLTLGLKACVAYYGSKDKKKKKPMQWKIGSHIEKSK